MRCWKPALKLCVVGNLNESGVSVLIAQAADAAGQRRLANRVVGQAHAVAVVGAGPEIGGDLVGVWREPERIVVLDVAHVAVEVNSVTAAEHVVALAVDVPGAADARQRERIAVVENAVGCAPGLDVAHAVEALVSAGIDERALDMIVERRMEIFAQAVEFLVVGPVAEAEDHIRASVSSAPSSCPAQTRRCSSSGTHQRAAPEPGCRCGPCPG